MIYITADTHFQHQNIIRFCERPFRTVKQMDSTMIRNWNRVVHDNDTIYHLGDFCLAPDYVARSIMKQLRGHKILIRGNHDRSKERMLQIGFNEVYNPPITRYGVTLTHEPMYMIGKTTLNIGVDVNNFTPIPFPMRRDVILCGHVHEKWMVRRH